MPRIEDQHKQEIKQQIWLKIQQNQGIRTAEIADQLKLDRRRVQNYLAELRDEGKIEQEGWGWLSLEFRGPRLYRFELSPEEVITLYLGARLLVKQHDQRNEPAETALRKLATVLRSDAPIGQEIERAADELAQREEDHEYQSIFRKIAQAYAYRKKLKLVYKPPGSNPFPTVFSVYLIEPSLVGAATYIIGHSSNVDAVREYKLGRIQSAELTDENCTIPPEYQGLEVMRHAWSVIGGEAKIEVVLRFSPKVRERVLETRWHPSQETKDDPEKTGWLRWQVKVPSTLDMLPWIRGWGADCEVVGPEGLREKLETEAKRLMHRYNIASPKTTEPQQRLLRCWGKTGKHELDFHPALFHMLDVGHTAYHLLSAPASPRWRKALVRAFNTDDETLVYWLPWLIALHDIGKISVPFQAQNASQKARLEREGFEFGAWKPKDKIHHTDMGRLFLKYEYDEADLPPWPQRNWLRRAWLEMVGGHHGTFPGLRQEGDSLSRSRKHMRSLQVPEEWAQLRQRADQLLRTFFLSATPVQWPEPQNVSVAIMALTGFTILCDWLGSDERYFMPHSDTDLLDYVAHSRQQAREAVTKAGFFQPSQSPAPAKFEELFPDRTPPRPLQQAIDEIPEEIIQQYNLNSLQHKGWIYIEIRKGMPGLKQAGKIANDRLTHNLAQYGYRPKPRTPSLWKHDTRPVGFTLVVDDFGVKYVGNDHFEHLCDALRDLYEIRVDKTGSTYLGMTLKWDYKNQHVDISMPGYVEKAIRRFQNVPTGNQKAPFPAPQMQFGKQYTPPPDISQKLPQSAAKHIQQVVGTFLYYALTIDLTMLVALGSLAAQQNNPTQKTMSELTWFLDYCAANPDATIRYKASDMTLWVVSDASYLSEANARSRAGGLFFLSDKVKTPTNAPITPPKPNGVISCVAKILRNIMSSAMET